MLRWKLGLILITNGWWQKSHSFGLGHNYTLWKTQPDPQKIAHVNDKKKIYILIRF